MRAVDLLDTSAGPKREIGQIATLSIREPHAECAALDESIQIDGTTHQESACISDVLTDATTWISGCLTNVRGRQDEW